MCEHVSHQETYDKLLGDVDPQARTPEALIKAVVEKDDVNGELFEILLMCEHRFSALCKTVWSWSKAESREEYVERVSVSNSRDFQPREFTSHCCSGTVSQQRLKSMEQGIHLGTNLALLHLSKI